MTPLEKHINGIEDLISVQDSCCTSDYMVGLRNGLECARSCATGEDPKYLDPGFRTPPVMAAP